MDEDECTAKSDIVPAELRWDRRGGFVHKFVVY